MRSQFLFTSLAICGIPFAAAPQSSTSVWTETNLYIATLAAVGGQPSGLTVGKGGFYGEMGGAGAHNFGTLFLLSPPPNGIGQWSPTVLYNFTGGNDGARPTDGLLATSGETFFGVAGMSSSVMGTVFELTMTPTPQMTVLYTFSGPDGESPLGPLISDKEGSLYGATQFGGPNGQGLVYELSPPTQGGTPWIQTILYAFAGAADGGEPMSGLIMDSNGALYGTTAFGGQGSYGTVFRMSPPAQAGGTWTETVLYGFQGGRDGRSPAAKLSFDKEGNLYGTTVGGGASQFGVVFRLTPPASGTGTWRNTVLHSFTGGSDGTGPAAGVSWGANGLLYGTAEYNGMSKPNCGVVFSLAPATGSQSWTENIVYAFQGGSADGCYPVASLLIAPSGAIYSTTLGSATGGTVFELKQ